MTGTSSIALALAPDVMIIALGMLLGRFLENNLWVALDKLCFYVFFPTLMFTAAAARPIGFGDIASIGVAVWVLMGLGFVLAWPLRRIGPQGGAEASISKKSRVCTRHTKVSKRRWEPARKKEGPHPYGRTAGKTAPPGAAAWCAGIVTAMKRSARTVRVKDT